MKLKERIYDAYRRLRPVVSYRGLKVPLHSPPVSRKIFQQLSRGQYEGPELVGIEGLLQDGDRVLELGSGLGIVSALTSQMRPGINVRTYEANPDLLPFIRQLHHDNGITNVDLRHALLMPHPTAPTQTFNLHRSFAESSMLEHGALKRRVEVPCSDLNSVIAEFSPQLLVCDIEGGEERVFNGIDLAGLRGLVIELHPRVVSRAGIAGIYDACASAGLYPRVELSSAQVVAFERVDRSR